MFWLMRLVHMGIQSYTYKEKKKKKKIKDKTPPHNLFINDRVSDFMISQWITAWWITLHLVQQCLERACEQSNIQLAPGSGGQFHRHELDKGGEVFRSSLKIYFTVAFHHLSSLYLNCSYAIFKSHGRFKL